MGVKYMPITKRDKIRVNLSLVLTTDLLLRLDFMHQAKLSDVDRFVTDHFASSKELRAYFQEPITQFLKDHESTTRSFLKNKEGSIVITFTDEEGIIRRLRMLYREEKQKTDPKYLKKLVMERLKTISPVRLEQVLNKYAFLFDINFTPRELKALREDEWQLAGIRAEQKNLYYDKRRLHYLLNMPSKAENIQKSKQVVLSDVSKALDYFLHSPHEEMREFGYYYLRLLESHTAKLIKDQERMQAVTSTIPKIKNLKVNPQALFEAEQLSFFPAEPAYSTRWECGDPIEEIEKQRR